MGPGFREATLGGAGTIFRSDGLCCASSVASHGAPDPAADENYRMGSGRTSTTVTFRDRRFIRLRLRLIHCKTQSSNIYIERAFVRGRSVASVRAKARPANHRGRGSTPPHEPTTQGPPSNTHERSYIPVTPEQAKQRAEVEADKFKQLSRDIKTVATNAWRTPTHGNL